MTLDQQKQRLSQLTQELHDSRLHYLREALDPHAPPGSRMLVIYIQDAGNISPPRVMWVITAAAGVQSRYELEPHHPEALSLLATLLQTPELGESPNKTEQTFLMQLNVETSGPLRDERKSWMARTYQFLGERQTPEPRPTSSRSNSAKRKVTPPKKRDVQTEPAPASPSQEAAPVKESEKKNENAGQPEEAPSPEARARVGDIWAAFSSTLSHKPAYFLKVTEQTGEDYSCQRCSSAGEVQEDAEKFSLSATKLSGTHRLFRLHQRK